MDQVFSCRPLQRSSTTWKPRWKRWVCRSANHEDTLATFVADDRVFGKAEATVAGMGRGATGRGPGGFAWAARLNWRSVSVDFIPVVPVILVRARGENETLNKLCMTCYKMDPVLLGHGLSKGSYRTPLGISTTFWVGSRPLQMFIL